MVKVNDPMDITFERRHGFHFARSFTIIRNPFFGQMEFNQAQSTFTPSFKGNEYFHSEMGNADLARI